MTEKANDEDQPCNPMEQGALFHPDTSVLLLVDAECELASTPEAAMDEDLGTAIGALCRAAGLARVPIIASIFEPAPDRKVKKKHIANDGLPDEIGVSRFIRNGLNPWDDETLVHKIRSHKRRRMAIIGSPNECSVTMAALSALAEGFDVHVVVFDGRDDGRLRNPPAALQRLIQAGVVPVAWHQVVLEWARVSPCLLSDTFLQEALSLANLNTALLNPPKKPSV